MVDSNDFTIYPYDEFTGTMAKPITMPQSSPPREPTQERNANTIPTASPAEAFAKTPPNDGVPF